MAGPSIEEFVADAVAVAQQARSKLRLAVGQKSRLLVDGAAAMADRLVGYAARLAKATYLDGALGDDLTAYADDRWSIQRMAAVKAYAQVTFTRATYAAGAGTIPAGFEVASARDARGVEQRFTTDAPAVFGPTTLSATVGAHAEVGGIAGNVGAHQIIRVLGQAFDPTILVDNASQAVGGTEEESDEDLRERCRQFPQTIRRGTLAALEYGAKTVPGVARATAVEDATGLLTVYVTDLAGNSNASMVAAVAAELENWRAGGSSLSVVGGSLFTQDVTMTLSLLAGTAIEPLRAPIAAVVSAAMSKLKINETLYPILIQSAARSVAPDVIKNVTVTDPSGPRVPSAGQIIRMGVCTVN